MKRLLALIGVAAGLSSGCAQLEVQVDILDPTYAHRVVNDGALQVVYDELQANGKRAASAPIRRIGNEVREAGKKLAQAYETLAQSKADPEKQQLLDSANSLRKSLLLTTGFVQERENQAAESLEQAATKALDASMQGNWRRELAIPTELRAQLEAIVELRRRYAETTATEIRVMLNQAREVEKMTTGPAVANATANQQANAAGQQLTKIVTGELKSLIGNGTLVGSEYAYVVAKAGENYWSPAFNNARASGMFGNSDFVIKMSSLGDFTVKGMRFDASTVAAVASKVTIQALLLGAQMAGVPVSKPAVGSATGDGANLADASGQLAANDAVVAQRKASLDAWRQAVREMASAILAEDGTLKSSATNWDTDKNQVISPISTSFDALTPVLRLEGVQ